MTQSEREKYIKEFRISPQKSVSKTIDSSYASVESLLNTLEEFKKEYSLTNEQITLETDYERGYYDSVDVTVKFTAILQKTEYEIDQEIENGLQMAENRKKYEYDAYLKLKEKFEQS